MSENKQTDSGRRKFVGAVAAAGGLAAIAPGIHLVEVSQARPAGEAASKSVRWGMLIDTTKCSSGCTDCVKACATENGINETVKDARQGSQWIRKIDIKEVKTGRQHSLPMMCQHCANPPCVDVCPTGASMKRADGIVLVDRHICIGCRYCMMACPFQIPKFEWGSAVPLIRKCDFCADRIDIGLAPSCATACPSEALLFGERQELLKEAHRRIGAHPGKYYPEVYGEKIVGGTAKLYLTPVSFEALELDHRGFRTDLGNVPYGIYGREWMSKVPFVALGVGGLAVGLHYLNQRRAEVQDQKSQEGKED
ncbi:MAG: Ni/Fe hydrogenase [Pseudomonadota bacterium]|nr:Ni/Fe hydrogenase [Pseudomonadota bacterium]